MDLFFYEFNILHLQEVIGNTGKCCIIFNFKIDAFKTYLFQRRIEGKCKPVIVICFVFHKCNNIGYKVC